MNNIASALKTFAQFGGHGSSIIVKRTDHPHIAGDYYYAIRPADKRKWTAGETALTEVEVADLWYAADCPNHNTQTFYPELANLRYIPA